MSVVFDSGKAGGVAVWHEWLPVLGGLLVLYVPTFYGLAGSHWQRDDGGHGPVILAVLAWLIWRRREAALFASVPARAVGYSLLVPGLLLYVLGRSQEIPVFEVGALAPMLAGTLLALRGWPALRAIWFPILFAVFLVPLPGTLVDALTTPLKEQVSEIAEQVLYAAGYPVARNGVVLTIGQYQLLVADACSGLQSMFSLVALGLLYMYLTARISPLHNAVMLISIVPIAFGANIVRVLMLMLVTYHFGDAAAQGFLHGATGVLLLMVALICLMALDALLAWVLGPRHSAHGHA